MQFAVILLSIKPYLQLSLRHNFANIAAAAAHLMTSQSSDYDVTMSQNDVNEYDDNVLKKFWVLLFFKSLAFLEQHMAFSLK